MIPPARQLMTQWYIQVTQSSSHTHLIHSQRWSFQSTDQSCNNSQWMRAENNISDFTMKHKMNPHTSEEILISTENIKLSDWGSIKLKIIKYVWTMLAVSDDRGITGVSSHTLTILISNCFIILTRLSSIIILPDVSIISRWVAARDLTPELQFMLIPQLWMCDKVQEKKSKQNKPSSVSVVLELSQVC